MSKKVRGSARNARRAAARNDRTARRTAPAAPVSQLAAAEVVAQDIEQDEPAEAAAELRQAVRSTSPRQRAKAGSVLAARAATEYLYVAQDMRRILAVAGALFGILVVLWVLIVVLRVIPLPFY